MHNLVLLWYSMMMLRELWIESGGLLYRIISYVLDFLVEDVFLALFGPYMYNQFQSESKVVRKLEITMSSGYGAIL